MSQPYAGRSHDEAIAARKGKRQPAQAPPGGEATITGTEPDPEHGSGCRTKATGSGMNGAGKE